MLLSMACAHPPPSIVFKFEELMPTWHYFFSRYNNVVGFMLKVTMCIILRFMLRVWKVQNISEISQF
jgi:hypothetical protein